MAFMERVKKAQKSGANKREEQREEKERKNRQNAGPAHNTRSNHYAYNSNMSSEPFQPLAPPKPTRNKNPSPIYEFYDSRNISPQSLRPPPSSSPSPLPSNISSRISNSSQYISHQSSRNNYSPSLSYVKPYPVTKQFEQNVFYENSSVLKMRMLKNCIKITSIVFLALLALFCFFSATVKPFTKTVPVHGYVRNGVLYCEFGYKRQGNNCVFDVDMVEVSNRLAIEIVDNMKYEWGNYQCETGIDITPEFQVSTLSKHIKNKRLNKQQDSSNIEFYVDRIIDFFSSKQNQQKYKFKFDGYKLLPTESKTNLACKIKNFFVSIKFVILVVVLVIVGVGFYKYFDVENEKRRAEILFHQIRDIVLNEGRADLNVFKERNQSDDCGRVGEEIWERVEKLRAGDKRIARLQKDNTVFWKLAK